MKELILNILAAIIFLIGLYIVIFGIGGVLHKAFFEDKKDTYNGTNKR